MWCDKVLYVVVHSHIKHFFKERSGCLEGEVHFPFNLLVTFIHSIEFYYLLLLDCLYYMIIFSVLLLHRRVHSRKITGVDN